MAREDLTGNVMFEFRPGAAHSRRYLGVWEKRISDQRRSMSTGPEVGVCLRYLMNFMPGWLEWDE